MPVTCAHPPAYCLGPLRGGARVRRRHAVCEGEGSRGTGPNRGHGGYPGGILNDVTQSVWAFTGMGMLIGFAFPQFMSSSSIEATAVFLSLNNFSPTFSTYDVGADLGPRLQPTTGSVP